MGDFNGDGKADLVVGNSGDTTVSVLLGAGDGVFRARVDYETAPGGSPWVAVGDFDGDGRPDIAAAQWLSTLTILMNRGDGTFQPAGSYPVTSLAATTNFVTAGDIDGDGKADLAVANGASNSVVIFLSQGDGGFEVTQRLASEPGNAAVAFGDLDRDGTLDLVVVGNGSVTVSIGRGDGTFGSTRSYVGPISSDVSLALADLDGDGTLDVVATAQFSSVVSVQLGNGDGTLLPRADYSILPVQSASSVAIADLDGDGKLDLAVTATLPVSVTILQGNGDGTYRAGTDYLMEGSGSRQVGVAVVDFSGDGKPGLAVTSGGDSLTLLPPRGDGVLGPRTPVLYPTGVGPDAIVAVDLDRDGYLDLAVSNSVDGTVSLLRGTGDGRFQPRGAVDAGAGPSWISAADFDRDGNPDVLVLSSSGSTLTILLGTGDGGLAPGVDTYAGQWPQGLAVADVNADGWLDATVLVSNRVSVFRGAGDGGLTQSPTGFDLGFIASTLATGDFDRDGKPDLVVGELGYAPWYYPSSLHILLGNGDGTFRSGGVFPTGSGPFSISVGDFNLDGKEDLATANLRDNTVSVLLGLGNGSFQAAIDAPVGPNPGGLAVGDTNGDGIPDLAVINNRYATVSVLQGKGDGTFSSPRAYRTGPQPTALVLADFSRTGRADLAAVDASTQEVLLPYSCR